MNPKTPLMLLAPELEPGADLLGDVCTDPVGELEAKLLHKAECRPQSECFSDTYGCHEGSYVYPYPTIPDEWFRDEFLSLR